MKFASATNLHRNSGERSGGTCFLPIPLAILERSGGTCFLPIPLAILEGNRNPPLCHPDRSGGICGSFDQQQLPTKAPSPLSPRLPRLVVGGVALPAAS